MATKTIEQGGAEWTESQRLVMAALAARGIDPYAEEEDDSEDVEPYTHCDSCNADMEADGLQLDDMNLCESCVAEFTMECPGCGDVYWTEDAVDGRCSDCFEEARSELSDQIDEAVDALVDLKDECGDGALGRMRAALAALKAAGIL